MSHRENQPRSAPAGPVDTAPHSGLLHASASPVAQILSILRRRRWLFAANVVLIVAVVVASSLLRTPTYSASSKVLIGGSRDIPLSVAGGSDSGSSQDPARLAATEAQVVRLRAVIEAARTSLGITDESTDAIRDRVAVSLGIDSDLLTISFTDTSAERAKQLADAVAQSYVRFRTALDTSRIDSARRDLEARLSQLRSAGQTGTAYYNQLLTNSQQLATLAKIGTTNYSVVETADHATQVTPKPVRDGLIGLVLGVLIGLGVTLLVDRLDRGVRDEADVESTLNVPLLARVALPGGKPKGSRPLVSLENPASPEAEAFRLLRANFEFTAGIAQARVVLLTSASEGEGKTTIAVNLAVALAQAGRRVALVDLDLRRPTTHLFFDLPRSPGATQVIAGQAALDSALLSVSARETDDPHPPGTSPRILYLRAGVQAPNPGQLTASRGCQDLLHQLRERAEFVLVDAPPLLACGDAKSLAPGLDACLIAVNPNSINRNDLSELHRELQTMSPPALGFVRTGARLAPGYGYSATKGETTAPPPMSDPSSARTRVT